MLRVVGVNPDAFVEISDPVFGFIRCFDFSLFSWSDYF